MVNSVFLKYTSVLLVNNSLFSIHRAKGNYSPSKSEERSIRKDMLNVKPVPITPPMSQAFEGSFEDLDDFSVDNINVEVIRVGSQDPLQPETGQ